MVDAGKAYPATMRLYNETVKGIPGARGSGIVAKKSGYHSSRNYNRAKHPGNYSIVLAEDLQGPADAAAAIDITPKSSADMRKLTKRLRDAFNARDPRVRAIKEFYGSLNTTNGRNGSVFGLGKKSSTGAPYVTYADDSHLWHLHISIFRKYVNDWAMLKGIVEVLTGKASQSDPKPSTPSTPKPSTPKPSNDWSVSLIMSLPTVKKGSKGASAKRVQSLLAANGFPPAKSFKANGVPDGIAGSGTDAAIRSFQRHKSLAVDGIVGKNTYTRLLKG